MQKYSVLWLMPLTLFAITTPRQEQLFNEEQRKKYEEQLKLQNNSFKKSETVEKLDLNNESKSEPCIHIDSITFDKNELLSKNKQQEFTKNYINQCNSITKLNNLTKRISNYFIQRGFSTSRAYIKPQKLSSKKLHISILEGKIENFIVKNLNTNLIFFSMHKETLNIRDLEMGIEQLSRLQSQKANIELKPSQTPGFSDVYILGEQSDKIYNGTLGVNNFGSEENGRLQYSATFNLENLLNINDTLSLSLNNSQENNNKNDNNGHTISYGFPLYRFYLKWTYSNFQYNQNVNNALTQYSSYGLSQEYKFDVNYKAFHNLNHRVEMNSGIKVKDNDNLLNNVKWESSSYRYSLGYFSIQHTFSDNLFQMYTIWKYTKGLNAFSISNPTELNHRFEKYNFDLNMTKYFKSESNIRITSLISAQYSPYKLFSSEQISVGGPYSVRGFNGTSLSGNSGYYIRNELGYSAKTDWFNYDPYVGLDYGFIKKSSDASHGDITGGVIGTRFRKRFAYLDLFYSFPINDAHFTKDESSNFFGFNLSLSF